MKNSADLIVFDLDGTLVDTLADIAECMNTVLANFGHPTRARQEYEAWVGGGTHKMIPKAAPAGVAPEPLYREFVAHYAKSLTRHSAAYGGIDELLQHLSSINMPMAVLTNKDHTMATEIIDALFPGDTFSAVVGLKPGAAPKPDASAFLAICKQLNVDPQKALMVGDTAIDINTGRNAGAQTVGVTWGYGEQEELVALRPSGLIDEPDELRLLMGL